MAKRNNPNMNQSNPAVGLSGDQPIRVAKEARADFSAQPQPADTADQSSRPANETLVDLTPAQRAAEAARVGLEDQSVDIGAMDSDTYDSMASGAPVTGGDPDAKQEQAKMVGEEAIGGTTPTPDQSNVDDVAAAAGINTQAEHPVKVFEEMQKRDQHRHELDPESKGPAASA